MIAATEYKKLQSTRRLDGSKLSDISLVNKIVNDLDEQFYRLFERIDCASKNKQVLLTTSRSQHSPNSLRLLTVARTYSGNAQ